jgi:AcrR family transcriptional regulator
VPRRQEENQRIRDEQREKILDAAKKVFARKGLVAAKMTDIAAAAGVSYGLAYHYFANKETIFIELVNRAMSGTNMIVQYALQRPGTPWEKLYWLTERIMEGLRDNPEYALLMQQVLTEEAISEEARQVVYRDSLLLQESESMRKAIRQLVVEGQAAGQVVVDDPDQLSVLYTACIQGLAAGEVFKDRPGYAGFAYTPGVEQILRMFKA